MNECLILLWTGTSLSAYPLPFHKRKDDAEPGPRMECYHGKLYEISMIFHPEHVGFVGRRRRLAALMVMGHGYYLCVEKIMRSVHGWGFSLQDFLASSVLHRNQYEYGPFFIFGGKHSKLPRGTPLVWMQYLRRSGTCSNES